MTDQTNMAEADVQNTALTANTNTESAIARRRVPTVQEHYGRALSPLLAFDWLKLGTRDAFFSPISSLFYGIAVFLLSWSVVLGLYELGFSYVLLPAVAAFMIIGPMLAIGLYEKSRLLASVRSPSPSSPNATVRMRDFVFVKAKSPGQLFLVSVLLLLVMLFWLRTAIMLYALFFGLKPFVGLQETINAVFFTDKGLTLLAVGSSIGAVLAAFTFSLSAFSIPILMNENKDAITAMVISLLIAWTNKLVVFVWGMVVLGLFLLSVATGFLGLVIVFPILGHATWHAYKALRHQADIDAGPESD